jgi:hypothetical protein
MLLLEHLSFDLRGSILGRRKYFITQHQGRRDGDEPLGQHWVAGHALFYRIQHRLRERDTVTVDARYRVDNRTGATTDGVTTRQNYDTAGNLRSDGRRDAPGRITAGGTPATPTTATACLSPQARPTIPKISRCLLSQSFNDGSVNYRYGLDCLSSSEGT